MSEPAPDAPDPLLDLLPLLRRVVAARVSDPQAVDDLVQETLARVMAARGRVEGSLAPYAVATARNLIASRGRHDQRAHRLAHLLDGPADPAPPPDQEAVREEERALVNTAVARLPAHDREVLLAHEVGGADTASIAAERGSTPGAVAAHLNRTRARLRVEYLLAHQDAEPPTDRCRPVLLALSAGDRRRQRELDVRGHLLQCDFCDSVSTPLRERRPVEAPDDVRVTVARDADIVTARQRGREAAARAGLTGGDLTLVATAISEIARNTVRFAVRGEFVFSVVTRGGRTGLRVVARDRGPGIPDVARALRDGYSTSRGLGLGLPGARRLVDEFEIASTVGEGTTVTMTKWRAGPATGPEEVGA